jgi:hypothetical protein
MKDFKLLILLLSILKCFNTYITDYFKVKHIFTVDVYLKSNVINIKFYGS